MQLGLYGADKKVIDVAMEISGVITALYNNIDILKIELNHDIVSHFGMFCQSFKPEAY